MFQLPVDHFSIFYSSNELTLNVLIDHRSRTTINTDLLFYGGFLLFMLLYFEIQGQKAK